MAQHPLAGFQTIPTNAAEAFKVFSGLIVLKSPFLAEVDEIIGCKRTVEKFGEGVGSTASLAASGARVTSRSLVDHPFGK